MEATLCLAKPFSTSHIHSTSITNRHQYASFHNPSSFPCISLRARPQQVSHHQKAGLVGAYSTMAVGPMSLSGALKACPKIVGLKDPVTGKSIIRRRVPAWRSLTLEGLRRGCLPLKVLLEAKKARLKPRSLDKALSDLVELLKKMKQHQHRVEFYELEEVARKLEMGRKEDLAVETLKKFLSSSDSGLGSLESFELKLILVEMLIYQGSYGEARIICKELDEAEHKASESSTPPDSRIPESIFSPFPPGSDVKIERVGPKSYRLKLYQAVTSNLMDEPGAYEQWKEFERVSWSYGRHRPPKTDGDEEFDEGDEEFDRPPFVGSGSPGMTKGDYEGYDEEEDHQQKPKPKYEQFLELVKVLKQEIHSAREVLGGGIK